MDQYESSLCQSLVSYCAVSSILNKLVSERIESNYTLIPAYVILHRTMSDISDLLPDAEQLAVSKVARELVHELEEVAYDIEDLLDQAAATYKLEKIKVNKVRRASDLFQVVSLRSSLHPLKSDLKFLLKRLDGILAKLKMSSSSSLAHKWDVPPTLFSKSVAVSRTSYYHKRLVGETYLGRERDEEQLIGCILSPSTEPIVIAVTGPGGIGKTTLVKQVCNDSRVSSSFDLVSWASYDDIDSLSFRDGLLRLTLQTEGSYKRHRSFQGPWGEENSLLNFLRGIKFLLVVDNIKHELLSDWGKLYLQLLEVGSAGSAVILIAWSSIQIGRFTKSFMLEGIPEPECWSLFKRCAAFDEDAEQEDSSLKDIGKSIVNKCGGSPLAIKILASLLCNSRDRHYWKHIDKTQLWGQGNEAWIAWCISLTLLPVELINSYTMLCIAKELHLWSRDTMVWFFMAHGLLQSTKKNQDLTDIGYRLLDELESNDILPFYNNYTLLGRQFEGCVSGRHTGDVNDHLLSTRMLSMWTAEKPLPNKFPETPLKTQNKARTFLFERSRLVQNVNKPFLKGLISNLKYLRVLWLDDCHMLELPESISNIKLLRYLSLADIFELQVLPESICKLVNLQTLDLSGCSQLKPFPINMHKLVNIRHLIMSGDCMTSLPGKSLKSWTSLHHLKISHSQNPEPFGKGILYLTALRTLQIHDCQFISSLPNSITCLTALKELSIKNCEGLNLAGWRGLMDSRSLKSLQLQRLPKLTQLPDMLLETAGDSLEHLVISYCKKLELTERNYLVPLRSLKSLTLECLPKLFHLLEGLLQSASNSIECLAIRGCAELISLPEILIHCTCLVEITISDCPNLISLPMGIHALRNLQLLTILKSPNLVQKYERETEVYWDHISHIPTIKLDFHVIRNRPTSTAQEKPGTLNLSPPSKDIRPASTTSSSEIIPVLEKQNSSLLSEYSYAPHPIQHHSVQSSSEHHHFKPPSTGAAEHSNPSPPHDMNMHVKPTLIPVTHRLDTDATGLDNQGASSNNKPVGKPVLELEKELEGRRLLFLFKEGYEFEKDMLIQLWLALGILTEEPIEEIGAIYFEKLVSEGYISCSDADSFYKVSAGRMKTELDVIRGEKHYVTLCNGNRNDVASAETFHISVICDNIDESIFLTLGRLKGLRILLFLGNYGSRLREVPRDLFLCYESLLALDLSGTHIKELPSSVEKMIHLRFLDLSWTFIELLPERMDRFQELQTLKLKGCSRLHKLPKELKALTKLRHLVLDILGLLSTFPKGIGALINLRTLSAFPVGIEEGLKISELKYLDNLTGEFCIAKLENVQSLEEAERASLTTKTSIKKLELRWSDHQYQVPKNEDAAIFENLCPSFELEEIHILCYSGTSFPGWITSVSFQKLVSISLFKCVHVSTLPSLEKLPALVFLELICCNSVVNVNFKGEVDNVAFPKLLKLRVDEMLHLLSWEEAHQGDYPCLVEIIIKDCPMLPELPSLPYLPSIEHLEVSGCTNFAFVSDKELSNSLLRLTVEDCPLIKERCSEQGGQDWHKIEQVPTIWIDHVAIKTNKEDLIDDGDDDDDASYYSDVFE